MLVCAKITIWKFLLKASQSFMRKIAPSKFPTMRYSIVCFKCIASCISELPLWMGLIHMHCYFGPLKIWRYTGLIYQDYYLTDNRYSTEAYCCSCTLIWEIRTCWLTEMSALAVLNQMAVMECFKARSLCCMTLETWEKFFWQGRHHDKGKAKWANWYCMLGLFYKGNVVLWLFMHKQLSDGLRLCA